jgi:hypothetical protein
MGEQRNINTGGGDAREVHNQGRYAEGNNIDDHREYKGITFDGSSNGAIEQVTINNNTTHQSIYNINGSPLDAQQLEQYQALQDILQNNPELLHEFENTSFEPQKIKNAGFALARTKHVSLEANLPVMFSEGKCRLRFSTMTLRGITLTFKHKEILIWFMTGLGLAVSPNTRLFFSRQNQDDQSKCCFSAGNSTFFLSDEEAAELCECVDFVIGAYRDVMILEEKAFKTYHLPIQSRIPDFQVKLLSVPKILWDLMIDFKNKYSNESSDNSEWHIFDSYYGAIRINSSSVYVDHLILFDEIDNFDNKVNVVLSTPHILFMKEEQKLQWVDYISESRIWDAEFSKTWLKDKFIPRVIQEYWNGLSTASREVINQWFAEIYQKQAPKSLSALKLNDLAQWIEEIKEWSRILNRPSINSELVIDYYRDVANLILESDIRDRSLDYPIKKMSWIIEYFDKKTNNELYTNASSEEDLLRNMLQYHSTRLEPGVMECMECLDSISRAFWWLILCADPDKSVVQINRAHRSTQKLWEVAYFEKRHIIDIRD